ncbi:MAG: hypothetical protein O2856_13690 [Planctomycetota bacterium]|nr:hypothetical protein [Planctomycetota bacterium]
MHVGCGTRYFEGWINVDSNEGLDRVDLAWDLADGLPTRDSSVRFIYSEHVVEHLPLEVALEHFRHCHRTLVDGGVLRIAMPSLDAVLQQSIDGTWRDQDWLKWPEYQFVSTRAEMLNISFRWWGHQWLYDLEELDRRLREVGFTEINQQSWGTSSFPELTDLESRSDSKLIVEARR